METREERNAHIASCIEVRAIFEDNRLILLRGAYWSSPEEVCLYLVGGVTFNKQLEELLSSKCHIQYMSEGLVEDSINDLMEESITGDTTELLDMAKLNNGLSFGHGRLGTGTYTCEPFLGIWNEEELLMIMHEPCECRALKGYRMLVDFVSWGNPKDFIS